MPKSKFSKSKSQLKKFRELLPLLRELADEFYVRVNEEVPYNPKDEPLGFTPDGKVILPHSPEWYIKNSVYHHFLDFVDKVLCQKGNFQKRN
jgi:hypothetical protein